MGPDASGHSVQQYTQHPGTAGIKTSRAVVPELKKTPASQEGKYMEGSGLRSANFYFLWSRI